MDSGERVISFFFVNTNILYIETSRPNTNRHVHAHKCLQSYINVEFEPFSCETINLIALPLYGTVERNITSAAWVGLIIIGKCSYQNIIIM
jgi:hypothetical protein